MNDGTYMAFVGVSTGASSIRRVFPRWAAALELPTSTLVGHDLPPDAEPAAYRRLVGQLRDDPACGGALVTTHKIGVYDAARDLFDELDELATTFGEVSSLFKRDGRLCGAARDPVTVRLALDEFLPPDHFTTTGGEVLVLGAGGAGTALSHALGVRTDRPARVTVTAVSEDRLEHQRLLHARAGIHEELFRYVLVDPGAPADALLAELPPGSLVANATGLGKDRPGSPLSEAAQFPERGYVWEFNYRGSLEFLHRARSAAARRSLVVEDGWRYFVHGWSRVVADVFAVEMPPERVRLLADLAAQAR